MKLYASIAKVEPQDDGTIKVYGYASSGAVDSDGETVSPEAMKAAIPDYMKFGAVREMHQPLAAGTAIEAAVEEDGKTTFGAHIVDPIAVKKVNASVYKGFSIGGKVLSRDKKNDKLITGLKLIEVSLVDRPANPEAVFTMYKAQMPVDEEAEDKAAIGEIAALVNAKKIRPVQILKASRAALAVRPKIVPAKMQKGMGALSQFAGLIQSIGWLTQDAAMEAEWEGDASPLPIELKDWLATGIMIFENMVTEETGELLTSLKPTATEVIVEQITASAEAKDLIKRLRTITAMAPAGDEKTILVAAADFIEKAGAKFSQETKDALADVHKDMDACAKGMKDCCDKMDALGYKDPPPKGKDKPKKEPPKPKPGEDDDDKEGDGNKGASIDSLAKSLTDAAVAQLKDELGKRDATIEALAKRLAVIEAQPVPAKGALLAVPVVVGKEQDGGNGEISPGIKPIFKADGTVDEAATLVKIVHAQGGTRLSLP